MVYTQLYITVLGFVVLILIFTETFASPFAPLQKHICHLQTQRMPRSPRVPMCSVEGFARLRTGCPRRWREGGCCSRERVLLALGRFATQTGFLCFLWLQTNQYDWGFMRIQPKIMGLLTQMQFYQELYLHSVSAESEMMDMINSGFSQEKGRCPQSPCCL